MSFNEFMKKFCGICLVLAMVFAMAMPVSAADVSFKQVDNDRVTASLLEEEETENSADTITTYKSTDIVRVAIFLNGKSVIEKGYSTMNIADNKSAMNYRQILQNNQDLVTNAIEMKLGEELDVVWNLTLATNLISANVEYGQIEEIEKVFGVKEVVIETQYTPAVLAENESVNDPQMAIATGMTGMTEVFNNGYTGAGSRVAIIDTGLDLDHQSFNAEAYQYALEKNAEAKEMDSAEYISSLDLLDTDELGECIGKLNVGMENLGVKAENVYKSSKVPFAFNYIDNSYDYVDHNKDSQSDHGSHVAGIAAANRYVKNAEGEMVDSVETFKVVGNAPDAQLMVMKVFGMNGGAYDSDIVAAMEDAILLGADSVNMSLGNGLPDFTADSVYQRVADLVKTTDSVLVVAAGNEGAWPDYSNTEAQLGAGKGLLYTDDVQMDRVARPASLTESMAVASVQNAGMINKAVFRVIDESAGTDFVPTYNEALYNNMKSLSSLDTSGNGTGTEYEYVFIDGFGDPKDGELDFIDVEGKIVFIQRGKQVAFSDKAAYAVSQGAIATIIYDNVDVTTGGMDMSAYTHEAPAVFIPKAAGDRIREMSDTQTDAANNVYYTGKLEVIAGIYEAESADDFYTMSSFSNWGTTGDLALKPEITAPGGNIYSVNGSVSDTDKYHVYSGTSMASPQIAGIVGTLKQYLSESGLSEKYGEQFSERQLSQSLMMSTAVPLKDANGHYYSLLQQGVGLVDGVAATSADSFIMMDNACLTDKNSGKVKAEVGDDPERKGIYEFSFDLYNTTDKVKSFEMSADVFAQDVVEAVSAPGSEYMAEYMSKSTIDLSSYAVFSENGVSQIDSMIDVPANGSVKVKVRIVLNDEAKAWLNEHYAKGTYLQAFVYAKPVADAEGAVYGVTHSIAMLGFYGNWTDPSMYDGPSYYEGKVITNYSTHGITDKSRTPYIENYSELAIGSGPNVPFYGGNHVKIAASKNSSVYAFGGNPLVKEEYHPERNALKNGAYISYWQYYLTRGSDVHYWSVTNKTTGEVYKEDYRDTDVVGAYYLQSLRAWASSRTSYAVGPNTIDVNYTLPELKEGEEIEISLTHLPEYYAEGKLGENSTPGEGATLKMSAVIDESNPVVSDIEYNADGTLDVTAVDSNYIAAVVLYSEDGKKVISYTGSKEDIKKGESAVFTVDAGTNGGEYLLQVFDYANNAATYLFDLNGDELSFNGNILAYDLETTTWNNVSRHSEKMESLTETTRQYTAATSVNDTIYAVAYGTDLYKLSVTDPDQSEFVTTLTVTPVDMAYNPVDGKLYAVTEESLMVSIDPVNGNIVKLGHTPIETNTLACDNNGVFYSNRYGTGSVFSYTLDAMKKADSAYDFSGDGVVNDIDGQTLLEYVTGVRGTIYNRNNADLDKDGDIDTYDVYLLYDKVPGSAKLLTTLSFSSKYMQAMECDPNSGKLYWASYSTEMFGENEIGFSVLYGIDTATGEATRYSDVWDQLCSLVILDKHLGSIYEPIGGTTGLGGAEDKFFENAPEQAGMATIMGVDNSAKDAFLTDDAEEQEVTVELKANVNAANGLYVVEYDTDTMTLMSFDSNAGLISMLDKNGVVTFGYAGKTALPANDSSAVLTFATSSCESAATVTLKEVNNDHPNTVSELKAGAHEWGEWSETAASTCTTEGQKERTCGKCKTVETEALPLDAFNHAWNNGKVLNDPTENEPGSKELTCDDCGEVKREWILPEGATLTEADVTDINLIYMEENCVMSAQIFEAGIAKAYRISTIDGSMRYLVELSSDTDWNADLNAHISSYVLNTGGVGYAIKGENTYGSIGATNAGSKLDYNFSLQNGIGVMKCWSYEHSKCTELALYCTVGEENVGDASVFWTNNGDTNKGNNDNYFNYIGIRGGGEGVNAVWEKPVVDGNVANFNGTVYLDASTPLDAEIVLEFRGSGVKHHLNTVHGVTYLCTEDGDDTSTNLTYYGLKVKLENGEAKVKVHAPVYIPPMHNDRYYNITISRRSDNAPVWNSSNGSADVAVGETYQLDLSTIFTDADEDALTYTVSVDGEEEQATDALFTYTPDTVGAKIFTFRAFDGTFYSEPYTLVLTARAGDVLIGDVNNDGIVNAKDATAMQRYFADWDGITFHENAADVNSDLKVNGKDATYLIRSLAGWNGYALP